MTITDPNSTTNRVAIVTGAAMRIGAATATRLHADGINVLIHYGRSASAAEALVARLNARRAHSATSLQADLADDDAAGHIVTTATAMWGRIDILVNNASTFYPTPLATLEPRQIDELFASNYRAPLLLAQAAAPHLSRQHGSILNMLDVHASRPHPNHVVYCSAKAALLMLTRALAVELAPDVRVNGIAPGSILWPEGDASLSAEDKTTVLASIPLQRNGTPEDIANTIAFLTGPEANYITGQILAVDGGRSL